MKKKGLIVLLLIFVLMFVLNTFTPLLSDEYFTAFVWPQRVRINDVSFEAIRRLSGFEDIFSGLRGYYYTWGGRVPGGFPVYLFVWKGKEYFNPINAFMIPALVAEIYWLSHEGKVSIDFNPSYLIWIFFALWAFNASFVDTCLWLAGSSNYLWMLVIVLAFLIPYVRNFFDVNAFRDCKKELAVGIFFLGILAGWSHETTNCWIVLVLSCWLYVSYKKGDLSFWKITGYIGFCIGYALLVFAPGNFSRIQMQQGTSQVIVTSNLMHIKLVELLCILLFHFIIWYLIISFFFKYSKHKERFIQKESGLYLTCALSFIMIALGSVLIMLFIPSNGLRPSFLSLAYLVIASSLLFRMQEVNNFFFVNNAGKFFLKSVGCVYLIITIFFSMWGSYINKCHLDAILIKVNEAHNNSVNTVLEFPPPVTMQDNMWLIGSGNHLVPLPVSEDEKHEYNKSFSYYYGIKGIKIRKE